MGDADSSVPETPVTPAAGVYGGGVRGPSLNSPTVTATPSTTNATAAHDRKGTSRTRSATPPPPSGPASRPTALLLACVERQPRTK
jgi:hypothetical protein